MYMSHLTLDTRLSYYQSSHSAGLPWSSPHASLTSKSSNKPPCYYTSLKPMCEQLYLNSLLGCSLWSNLREKGPVLFPKWQVWACSLLKQRKVMTAMLFSACILSCSTTQKLGTNHLPY